MFSDEGILESSAFCEDEVLCSYLEELVGFQRDYGVMSGGGVNDFKVVNGDIEDKLILWLTFTSCSSEHAAQIKRSFEYKNSDDHV